MLTTEAELYICGGRHPLQELCVSTCTLPLSRVPMSHFDLICHLAPYQVIPNNTSMSAVREGMLKLISGPNGSGKSVYVKQVGLIALMAHIGCYVPAGTFDATRQRKASLCVDCVAMLCSLVHDRECEDWTRRPHLHPHQQPRDGYLHSQ